MNDLIKISEAASLGLHTMALMSAEPGRLNRLGIHPELDPEPYEPASCETREVVRPVGRECEVGASRALGVLRGALEPERHRGALRPLVEPRNRDHLQVLGDIDARVVPPGPCFGHLRTGRTR